MNTDIMNSSNSLLVDSSFGSDSAMIKSLVLLTKVAVNMTLLFIIAVFKLRDFVENATNKFSKRLLQVSELPVVMFVCVLEILTSLSSYKGPVVVIKDGNSSKSVDIATIHELYWADKVLAVARVDKEDENLGYISIVVKPDASNSMNVIDVNDHRIVSPNDSEEPTVKTEASKSSIYDGYELEPDRLLRYKKRLRSHNLFVGNK